MRHRLRARRQRREFARKILRFRYIDASAGAHRVKKIPQLLETCFVLFDVRRFQHRRLAQHNAGLRGWPIVRFRLIPLGFWRHDSVHVLYFQLFLRLRRPLACLDLKLGHHFLLRSFRSCKNLQRRLLLCCLHAERLGVIRRPVRIRDQDADEVDPPLLQIFDPLFIEHRPLTQKDGHILSIYRASENHAFFHLIDGIPLQHPPALPCKS